MIGSINADNVVTRAIQLGIQDGAFGLAQVQDDEIDAETLAYDEAIPLDAISFEAGFVLVPSDRCKTLAQQAEERVPAIANDNTSITYEVEESDEGVSTVTTEPRTASTATERRYRRVRLVVEGVPAGKISHVNRGILLPIKQAFGEFTFTVEIDVAGDDGLPQAKLENVIKETIRQIGATIREEDTI